jgi:hypothetical protein
MVTAKSAGVCPLQFAIERQQATYPHNSFRNHWEGKGISALVLSSNQSSPSLFKKPKTKV